MLMINMIMVVMIMMLIMIKLIMMMRQTLTSQAGVHGIILRAWLKREQSAAPLDVKTAWANQYLNGKILKSELSAALLDVRTAWANYQSQIMCKHGTMDIQCLIVREEHLFTFRLFHWARALTTVRVKVEAAVTQAALFFAAFNQRIFLETRFVA